MSVHHLPIGNGERTGFRDLYISTLHRTWHTKLAFHDIDNMWIELKFGAPMAVVDYKRTNPFEVDAAALYVRAYQAVANCCQIPYFIVFYDTTPVFTVRPMNTYAFTFVDQDTVMSEAEYVALQFRVRRQWMPPNALNGLSTRKPVSFDDDVPF